MIIYDNITRMLGEAVKYSAIPVQGDVEGVITRAYDDPNRPRSGEYMESLLAPCIENLIPLFGSAGLSLPDQISSRFVILSEADYQMVLAKHNLDPEVSPDGITVNDGSVSHTTAKRIEARARAMKVPFDEALREIAIHEIIHTLGVRDLWEPRGDVAIRRSGVRTVRPVLMGKDREYRSRVMGLNVLDEGIIQFLTAKVTYVKSDSYREESVLVSYIESRIGTPVLIRAISTRHGLRELVREFDKEFGKGVFMQTLKIIGALKLKALQDNEGRSPEEEVKLDLQSLIRILKMSELL